MISNCERDAFIQIIIIDLEGTPRFCHSKNNNSVFETNQNTIIKHHQSNTPATHASACTVDIIDKQLHSTGFKPEAGSLSLANLTTKDGCVLNHLLFGECYGLYTLTALFSCYYFKTQWDTQFDPCTSVSYSTCLQ